MGDRINATVCLHAEACDYHASDVHINAYTKHVRAHAGFGGPDMSCYVWLHDQRMLA